MDIKKIITTIFIFKFLKNLFSRYSSGKNDVPGASTAHLTVETDDYTTNNVRNHNHMASSYSDPDQASLLDPELEDDEIMDDLSEYDHDYCNSSTHSRYPYSSYHDDEYGFDSFDDFNSNSGFDDFDTHHGFDSFDDFDY